MPVPRLGAQPGQVREAGSERGKVLGWDGNSGNVLGQGPWQGILFKTRFHLDQGERTGEPRTAQVRTCPIFQRLHESREETEDSRGAHCPTQGRPSLYCGPHPPRTPMARPPRAIPMALPLSSSSVYTLASMPIPNQRKKR